MPKRLLSLDEVLAGLGQQQCRAAVETGWDASMATLPARKPDWLGEPFIRSSAQLAGIDAADVPAMVCCANLCATRPELFQLLWHARRCLVQEKMMFRNWPDLGQALGEEFKGVFWLLQNLSIVPDIQRRHQQLGVPQDISSHTLRRLGLTVENHRTLRGGRLGVIRRQAYWLRNHLVNDLFHIGRMEYMVREFWGPCEVYRHNRTGAVIALAANGLKLDEQGYGADTSRPSQGQWTATLAATDAGVTGCPIDPAGLALREPVTLDAAKWRRIITRGTAVMEMHIPPGGSMGLDACGQSLRDAFDFFRRYLPHRPFEALWIISWIFNTQLQEIMGPDSNLARLQRELHLFPVATDGPAGLFFLFGEDRIDPATAPRDTSLRRAICEWLAAGNTFRTGGMLYFPADIGDFGSGVYRRNWPAALGLARSRE